MLTFALILVLAALLAVLALVGFMASVATDFVVLAFAGFVILFAAGLFLGLRRGGAERMTAGKGSAE